MGFPDKNSLYDGYAGGRLQGRRDRADPDDRRGVWQFLCISLWTAGRSYDTCGMLGLFVGVTNCPISTLLLGFELFGYEAMPFFVLVIAVSFSFSGYYSLYASQKFIYSKTRTEFINRKTNK